MDSAETNIAIGERQVHVGMQAQVRDEAERSIPLGRMGTPEDAANAVFFFRRCRITSPAKCWFAEAGYGFRLGRWRGFLRSFEDMQGGGYERDENDR